jgi:putative DNA primase/helicase
VKKAIDAEKQPNGGPRKQIVPTRADRIRAARDAVLAGKPIELPSPSAPLDVAKTFAAVMFNNIDPGDPGDLLAPTLLYWRGGWWIWEGPHWAVLEPQALRDHLYAFTHRATYPKKVSGRWEQVPWTPTPQRVNDVLDALKSACAMPVALSAEPPVWLDGRMAGTLVSCANGLLDIRTRELRQHSPRYFNLTSVPFPYEREARCEVYDKFVATLWDEDDEARRTLAQMLGYLISGRTDMQCVFGLIGPRRAGKGTIARLATALVGASSTAALTLASFADKHGLEHVVGKSLAIISDARTAGKDTQTVVERLLSISGEDAVPVARKYKTAWNGRMSARIMYLSNETPHLGDASTAAAHRFVMLVFSRSFAGQEDRHLEGSLQAELPGVLNVALDGLAELDRQRRFAQSAAALAQIEDAADLSSPLHVFMRDECMLGPNFRVEKDRLFQHYRAWCQRCGHALLNREVMARALYAAGGGAIGRVRGRDGEERAQYFTGIRLRDEAGHSVTERAAARAMKAIAGRKTPAQST